MTRMTGPDCAVMCNLINTHKHTNTQTHQHTNTISSHIMPCAAGELCKLADVQLIAPNGRDYGHECRGGCGGKLHGILCGEVEDPDGDSPTHRICRALLYCTVML